MKRPELAAQYRVAHELGRTVGELGEMPVDEFMHWCAYFRARDERLSG